MKLVTMRFGVVERQGNWLEEVNRMLEKAITVVMYETESVGKNKDLHIFAIIED